MPYVHQTSMRTDPNYDFNLARISLRLALVACQEIIMSQIDHLIVIPDHVVKRPSDDLVFRFQIYKLRHNEWGYKLANVDGHPTNSVSDPDYSSTSAVFEAIEKTIESWDKVPGYGWCQTDRVAPELPKL
jgi:hypothetical protein